MLSPDEVKSRLKTWIVSKSKHQDAPTITDETPIIERRILTSLQVMDLILFIESMKTSPLDPESLKPGVFSSVNKIYETFFQEQAQ